jgi:hypothetical protein
MKKLSVKKIILSSIAAFIAVFTIISLSFSLTKVDDIYGKYSECGFELLDFKSFFITSSYKAGTIGLALLSWLQLLSSVACIVFMALALFKKQDKIDLVNFISVIVCTVFAVLYLIEGIVYTSINANTWGDNFSTISFVPLIIIALFAIAYFVLLKILPNDFTFKNKQIQGAEQAAVEGQTEEISQSEGQAEETSYQK